MMPITKEQIKTIDYIKISFSKNFIQSLATLSKRKIEPITIKVGNEDIITGIKCPVIMNEDTFEQDKKIIESDILKVFTNILNSEICNRKRDGAIHPFPCPRCGNNNTISYGHRKTEIGLKATRYCKDCKKHYTNQEDTIWKMKHKRDIIEDALKLSEHNSLRDTARLIKEKYNIEISHTTIFHWQNNKKLQKNIDIRTEGY